MSERRSILLVAVAVEGGLALYALALGIWLDVPLLARWRWDVRDAAVAVAATVPLSALFVLLLRYPTRTTASLRAAMLELAAPLFCKSGLVDLAIVAALAGLGEELLFRGVLQSALARFIGSDYLAALLAAAAFGLAHPISKSYVLVASVVGVYLGALLIVTDNLLVPVAVHALYDFFALVYLVRSYRLQGQSAAQRELN